MILKKFRNPSGFITSVTSKTRYADDAILMENLERKRDEESKKKILSINCKKSAYLRAKEKPEF